MPNCQPRTPCSHTHSVSPPLCGTTCASNVMVSRSRSTSTAACGGGTGGRRAPRTPPAPQMWVYRQDSRQQSRNGQCDTRRARTSSSSSQGFFAGHLLYASCPPYTSSMVNVSSNSWVWLKGFGLTSWSPVPVCALGLVLTRSTQQNPTAAPLPRRTYMSKKCMFFKYLCLSLLNAVRT